MSFEDASRRIAASLTLGAMVATGGPNALAQEPPASQAEAEQPAALSADQTFSAAVELFKKERFSEALPIFTSLATTTASPNAWLYVGHCLVRLQRYPDAHSAFSSTLTEIARRGDDRYETTRQAAAAQLDWLGDRVSRLIVVVPEAPDGLVLRLDGQPVDTLAIASGLIVTPGSHQLEATGENVAPVTRQLQLEPGDSASVSLSFEAPSAAPAPEPLDAPEPAVEQQSGSGPNLFVPALVAGGVAVVGFGTFAIAGLGAKSAFDELSADCPGGCSDSTYTDRIDSGKSQQTLANVGLGIGIVGALASGTLLYLHFSKKKETGVSLVLSPSSTQFSYRARF